MVLENIPEPSDQNSPDHGAPISDTDPFATQNTPGTYHVDRSSLPRPFPILGPLLGFGEPFGEKLLYGYVRAAQNAVNRPLTQEEFEALAYWSAKQVSVFSYGVPLGMAGGALAAYRSAGTFRFPFWQPNTENFRPDVFPPNLATFRGNRAVMAWHASRLLAYMAIGSSFGYIIMGSYAGTTGAVGQMRDERLKPIMKALQQRMIEQRSSLPTPAQRRAAQRTGAQQGGSANHSPQDDASPAFDLDGYESSGLQNRYGNGAMGDGNIRRGDERTRARPWGDVSKAPPPQETYENQDTGFAVFDEASPTGGSGIAADTDAATQQGGSAWDRLRRGEKPQQSRQASPSRPAGPPQASSESAWSRLQNRTQQDQGAGDSFTFPSTYEDRDLAKAQAQKEFDAQVDRERQGGGFNDSRGNQKGW